MKRAPVIRPPWSLKFAHAKPTLQGAGSVTVENCHKSHRTLRPTERCEIFSEQTPTDTVHCTPTGAMRNATTFDARRQEPRAFLPVLYQTFFRCWRRQ
jgi:hypothetical protein